MSDEKRYVLCMRYADGAILYISGPDPAGARGSKDVQEAMAETPDPVAATGPVTGSHDVAASLQLADSSSTPGPIGKLQTCRHDQAACATDSA